MKQKPQKSGKFSPITLQALGSPDGTTSWSLQSGPLPRLLDCRARLVWRYAGETDWREDLITLPAFSGTRLAETLPAGPVSLALAVRKDRNGGWEFSGHLTNHERRPLELARFHYLDGVIEHSDDVVMLTLQHQQGGNQYCFRQGQELPAVRPPPSPSNYWWVLAPHERWLPDVIHVQPNWVCAVDCGVFFQQSGAPGWVLGATGPGKAFGEIGFRTCGADAGRFYAGQLLDNILLPPGETRELEKLIVLAGPWQNGLREWAAACARELGASPHKAPLTGFCSWYRNFAEITPADIDQAIAEFAEMPAAPGGRMIQIDDGFERAPGDWGPNARFPAEWWASLPQRVTEKGLIPALWLAPTNVFDTNPIVKEHPDWFQRLPDGRFAYTAMNFGWCGDPTWKFGTPGGHMAYGLEPDHPGAREFMRKLLQDAVAAGWRAFKLDFNVPVYNSRVPYDRSKTTFETLRDQYRFFREAVGPDVLLNACVGHPDRFTLGYADSCRISGDMVGDWRTIRELLPAVLLRTLATNGIWWSADPDVFYMRRGNSIITGSYFDPVPLSTSAEEQTMLLNAIGVMGGMLYTSDLPSEWTAEARQNILEFWNADGPRPAENPFLVLDEPTCLPRACRAEMAKAGKRHLRCALFNWSDSPATVQVSLAELGLDSNRPWQVAPSTSGIELHDGVLVSTQPAHSLRWTCLNQLDS